MEILEIFAVRVAPYVKEILDKVWIPPHEARGLIQERIKEVPALYRYYEVIVSGENENVSLYLIGAEDILVYTPFMDLSQNVVLSEISPKVLIAYDEHLCLVEKTDELVERLKLPNVILISPWLREVFPDPHMNLAVYALASYLRKYQKADVRIIDMLVGATVDSIVEEVKRLSPDVIGISIYFGYLPLCEKILKRIFSELIIQKRPIVMAGGPVAAFGYEELQRSFPDLLVCHNEGEKAMLDLVEYVKGVKGALDGVSGITYLENGKVKKNATVEIDASDIPLPAMDNSEKLIRSSRGVLSMEASRGCSHNACTFCTRINMCKKWKGKSPQKVLRELEYYKKIFDHVDTEYRVIFLADEDFFGRMPGGREMERVKEIMGGIAEKGLDVYFFELDARIDQVYNPRQSKKWHIEKMEMLELCKMATGKSLFLLGIESGSNTTLERFNKRIKVNDSLKAFRILTALGINCKPTFINFDPLMNFKELKENILLLERDDLLLQPVDLSKITYSELFDKVHDSEFVAKNSLHKPLYEITGFKNTDLQVLIGSPYVNLLKDAEHACGKNLLIDSEPDYNMGIYKVNYLDELINDIVIAYQGWFKRQWVLEYTLKAMYRVASGQEEERLIKFRTEYRKMCFYLLKSLIWLFDKENTLNMDDNVVDVGDMARLKEETEVKERKETIKDVVEMFEQKMLLLVDEIEESMNKGVISDNNDNLKLVIEQWRKEPHWSLV